VKLTYDDYALFPDDGLRHELINGELPDAVVKRQASNDSRQLALADRGLGRFAQPEQLS
jgi:hypothetical protein